MAVSAIIIFVVLAGVVVVGAGVAALVYFLTRDKSKRPDDEDLRARVS